MSAFKTGNVFHRKSLIRLHLGKVQENPIKSCERNIGI